MCNNVILGIDGGGTYTRIAITDKDGNLLSYVEWQGGAFLRKDAKAKENVANAILAAIDKADCKLSNIIGVAAGIAGYDNESDLEWVQELTNIDGLTCTSLHVNDTVIAHKGALLLKPGIIAISGTGSAIFGITESGKFIHNNDFYYYANSAARCLSYNCVFKIIAGEINSTDHDFVNNVCKHFRVKDILELAQLGSIGFINNRPLRDKLFADLAPVVTNAALQGSNLAQKICIQAAEEIITGIRLIGSCFISNSISISLIGSVANSIYIKNFIGENLKEKNHERYMLIEPALPPVLGAIIMAMQKANIEINGTIKSNLFNGAKTIYMEC